MRFRHELARIAIERSLAAPVAAALHAQVLACLERSGDAAVTMARLVHRAEGAGKAPLPC
jgi:hypothetical protein